MTYDLVLHNCRLPGRGDHPLDIAIEAGTITAIAPVLQGRCRLDATGGLVTPGLVDTHIHLDKSCIIERCRIVEGTLQEAVALTAKAKAAFTEDDITARARRTLERCILGGTMHMRTHVEVDPRIGLKGFHALKQLKSDYAWAIDLQICVFPQEGLLNDPGTDALLRAACVDGADLIGGCPYTDTDPIGHIAQVFNIARDFDLDIDFHLDFDIDPTWMHLDEVIRQTMAMGYGGRVTVGHVTKLSALEPVRLVAMAERLADAGIAVTILPATDLFLMGRGATHNVPRGVARADILMQHGVTCSLATNNVLNPFTPFGDGSLIRMANLYANISQLGTPEDLERCFAMTSASAAKLLGLNAYGISEGAPADLIVFQSATPAGAVAEIARPLFGLKNGRKSFENPPGRLIGPPC